MKELIVLIALIVLGSLATTGQLIPAATAIAGHTADLMSGAGAPDAKFIGVGE